MASTSSRGKQKRLPKNKKYVPSVIAWFVIYISVIIFINIFAASNILLDRSLAAAASHMTVSHR